MSFSSFDTALEIPPFAPLKTICFALSEAGYHLAKPPFLVFVTRIQSEWK